MTLLATASRLSKTSFPGTRNSLECETANESMIFEPVPAGRDNHGGGFANPP